MKIAMTMNTFEARALFNLIASADKWYDMNGKRTDLEPDEERLKENYEQWRETARNFGTKVPGVNG